MNTTQLLTLLARQPGISAGEIVTALEAKLADVSAELRSLVDVGDVDKRREFDANGRQCFVYELTDTFKASKAGQTVLAAIAGETPAPPAVDQVEQPAVPVVQKQRGATKVSKAIAFVQANGSASDDQLREAMGLAPKTYVAAYLKAALEAGKLWREGDTWAIPKEDAPLIAPTPERRQENKGPEARQSTFAAVCESIEGDTFDRGLKALPTDARAVPTERTALVHRCAIWSDGTYELQTDGARVALLTHDQAVAFVSFVERIGSAA